MTTSISCGTLVINRDGEILLAHVTNTDHWDIPKGMQDPGETPLESARREMREETGLVFDAALFEDLGCFDYRPDKKLHLFKLQAPESFHGLGHLTCASMFPHHRTGKPTPEVDDFQWARRDEIARLCWPRMAKRLLALEW